jgi:hypothetical protein
MQVGNNKKKDKGYNLMKDDEIVKNVLACRNFNCTPKKYNTCYLSTYGRKHATKC